MSVEASNYYGPHHTKSEYDHAFNNALLWAKKQLKERGIQARKDEKARLQHLKECTQNNELPQIEDILSI